MSIAHQQRSPTSPANTKARKAQAGTPTAGQPAEIGAQRGTTPSRVRLMLVLGALIALGPLSLDLYLPALPAITHDLATTESTIQLTLTGTMLGLGLGQLLVGPLSDAFGRRIPLLAGCAMHVVASLLCVVAPNVEMLNAARVLQGLGASAGAVLTLAVVRDLFNEREGAALFSRLILVMGSSPILAPMLGSAILSWTHWRGVFGVLAVLGLAIGVIAALALPETLPPPQRRPLALGGTIRTYGRLLTNRTFVGLMLVAGLTMAGLFAFVASGSFVFQQQFGLDQRQFGLLFGVSAAWMIAASQLNARLVRRYEPRLLLAAASGLATVSGAALLIVATIGAGGLFGVAVTSWATLFFGGLALPNIPAVALREHGEVAGTAAALLGAAQFGISALISPVAGLLGNDASSMGLVMAGGVSLATLTLLLVVRPWRITD